MDNKLNFKTEKSKNIFGFSLARQKVKGKEWEIILSVLNIT